MGKMLSGIFGGGDTPKPPKPPTDKEATKRQAMALAANRGEGIGSTNFSLMREAQMGALKRTLGAG